MDIPRIGGTSGADGELRPAVSLRIDVRRARACSRSCSTSVASARSARRPMRWSKSRSTTPMPSGSTSTSASRRPTSRCCGEVDHQGRRTGVRPREGAPGPRQARGRLRAAAPHRAHARRGGPRALRRRAHPCARRPVGRAGGARGGGRCSRPRDRHLRRGAAAGRDAVAVARRWRSLRAVTRGSRRRWRSCRRPRSGRRPSARSCGRTLADRHLFRARGGRTRDERRPRPDGRRLDARRPQLGRRDSCSHGRCSTGRSPPDAMPRRSRSRSVTTRSTSCACKRWRRCDESLRAGPGRAGGAGRACRTRSSRRGPITTRPTRGSGRASATRSSSRTPRQCVPTPRFSSRSGSSSSRARELRSGVQLRKDI